MGVDVLARVEYLLQGIEAVENHENKIADMLQGRYDRIMAYSAFLRKDAVMDIKTELEAHKGKVTALVGVRNGITSIQGLKCLLDSGAEVYCVDTGDGNRIFHPKTVVAVDYIRGLADVIIGSANITTGGFLNNIENSVILHLDLSDSSDKAFLDSFFDGYKHLLSDYDQDNVFKVDSSCVDELLDEGRIIDEDEKRQKKTIVSVGKNNKGNQVIKRMPIKCGKHRVPISRQQKAKNNKAVVVLTSFNGSVTEVWRSKKLTERDLNTPSGAKTNATGSMLLKKGAYNIDQQSYFRNEVFSKLDWRVIPKKAKHFEFAEARFHFIIDGIDNGCHTLMLKYDSRTNTKTYKQKQPNVSVSWGTAKNIMKNRALLDKIMHLYAVDGKDDEYVIEISND